MRESEEQGRTGEPVRVLPMLREAPPERADAARNRRRIVEAARRVVDCHGFADLSLDEVAKEAQLGVGTVYRRFGDRSALLYALLDESERQFQAAFTTGPPPLGPGAPPAERMHAFMSALVDHTVKHTELLRAAESGPPTGRFNSAPYRVYRFHLAILISQARPGAKAQFLADALLAPVSATLMEYQRTQLGMSYETIKTGLDELLDGLT